MSSSLRRTSLFNRRFALSRRAAAQSLPAGRSSIRQDAEGFDDLDEYFDSNVVAAAAAGKALPLSATPKGAKYDSSAILKDNIKPEDEWEDVKDQSSTNSKSRIANKIHDEELVPLNDDDANEYASYDENINMMDINTNSIMEKQPISNDNDDDDTEVSFKETIKVTKSPTHGSENGKSTDSVKSKNLVNNSSHITETITSNGKSISSVSTPAATKKKTPKRKAPAAGGRRKFEPIVELKYNDFEVDENGNDIRRGKRSRMSPLAYWRNEKVIYGRRQSSRMPVIVDVLRKDELESSSPTTKRPKRTASKKKTTSTETVGDAPLKAAGYKPNINVTARVFDYDNHREDERLLALGADGVEPEMVKGESFSIQTIFTEGSFLSSGILEFPPKSSKPSRNSSKHALVFYVIEGTVEVTINGTAFIVGTGSQFIVPRGNHYSIKSTWNKTTRIFFCHCKDTLAES